MYANIDNFDNVGGDIEMKDDLIQTSIPERPRRRRRQSRKRSRTLVFDNDIDNDIDNDDCINNQQQAKKRKLYSINKNKIIGKYKNRFLELVKIKDKNSSPYYDHIIQAISVENDLDAMADKIEAKRSEHIKKGKKDIFKDDDEVIVHAGLYLFSLYVQKTPALQKFNKDNFPT
eukprot:321449_1